MMERVLSVEYHTREYSPGALKRLLGFPERALISINQRPNGMFVIEYQISTTHEVELSEDRLGG